MITEKELRIAGATYLSALGYYVEILPEVPSYSIRPDVMGILPRLRDLKEREKIGTPPAGLLYLLLQKKWLSFEEITSATNYEENFVQRVLQEGEMNGWICSQTDGRGLRLWSLGEYKIPVKESVLFFCGTGDVNKNLEALEALKGCYHKGIMLFPYKVTPEFKDLCFTRGIGIMQYHERIAYFEDILPPDWQEVELNRPYLSLCEKILYDNLHFRFGEGI